MSRKAICYKKPSTETLNELKFEICKAIDWEIGYFQMGQTEAAAWLGTSQANISRVRRKRVEQLSFNQLFNYLVSLRPDIKMTLSSY